MMIRATRGFAVGSILALLAWTAFGRTPELPPPAPAASPAPTTDLRERIVELPEDGGVWWLTTCLPSDYHGDPTSRRLLAALSSEPRLQSLQAQCKTHVFHADDAMFQQRWATYVGALPALLVQRPGGQVCYKASGADLPTSPLVLADEIAAAIQGCCPKPKPNPVPAPTPAPAPAIPQTPPATIPDIRPQPEESAGLDGVWLAALAGVAGAVAGVASEWKKSTNV